MTGLRDKIPVEPLDERRYDRLEQRVMAAYEGIAFDYSARPTWRERLWPTARKAGLVVALAAVLAMAYISLQPAHERTSTTATAGQSAPARLVTDETGETTYHVGNAEIVVAPSSALEIRREPVASASASVREAVHVDLLSGAIDCDVEPIDERPPFIVHAGEVDVIVVGTAFRVEHTGNAVRVSVLRGRVRVQDPSGERFLDAGQEWTSSVQIAAAAGESGPGENVRRIGENATERGADWRADGDTGSDSRLRARTANTPGFGDAASGDGRLRDRSATTPDGKSRKRRRDSGKARKKRNHRKSGSHAGTDSPGSESKERRELKRARPTRGTPPAGTSELTDIMATEVDDPRAAIADFRRFSLGRGAGAEFALYSVAYLQAMKLGQRSKALTTLKHYQRRFARGKYRESALWLRIRVLCAGEGRNACRAAAHSYLKDFPGGDHADLASRIIHWGM